MNLASSSIANYPVVLWWIFVNVLQFMANMWKATPRFIGWGAYDSSFRLKNDDVTNKTNSVGWSFDYLPFLEMCFPLKTKASASTEIAVLHISL
jgi:hypothetical protein